ncbi:MAG: hypothetical protein QOH58_277 [Thermoleophilaceae bacterium]|nr:hypothetical protein [Thermoleophilaceae bacterium]
MLAPVPYRWLCAVLWELMVRLPLHSRLRRRMLVRACLRAYGAFNRRDLPVFLSMFDPEIVYDASNADWPERQIYEGLPGMVEMTTDWYSTWQDFRFDLREVHDLGGNRCLLMSEFQMTGQESGVPLEHVQWQQLGTARRGRWVRVDNFTDRAEALRAGQQEAHA